MHLVSVDAKRTSWIFAVRGWAPGEGCAHAISYNFLAGCEFIRGQSSVRFRMFLIFAVCEWEVEMRTFDSDGRVDFEKVRSVASIFYRFMRLTRSVASLHSEGARGLGLGGRSKRASDIILASTALVFALPVMLFVAVVIRVVMGGPVLFSQERVGFNGRRFKCFKFRTMAVNGDEILRRHLDENPDAAREWAQTRKLGNDPRVGRLGRLLRKSSLDELPQLINILRGEMSCVGPRPIPSSELVFYGEHQDEYLSAVPGLTGLWQCSGRSALNYAARVELDSYYVRNWSMLLDLYIIVRTIPSVLRFHQTA
ncbi:MAG: sugar transferase [Hyphomicrobiaceae bacterium]